MKKREDPCTVTVQPDDRGGVLVELHIPSYSGEAVLSLQAERSAEGDWIVFIPWPDGVDGPCPINDNLCDASNGVAYIGAPEELVTTIAVELEARSLPTITVEVEQALFTDIDRALSKLAEDDDLAGFIIESGYTVVETNEVGG